MFQEGTGRAPGERETEKKKKNFFKKDEKQHRKQKTKKNMKNEKMVTLKK